MKGAAEDVPLRNVVRQRNRPGALNPGAGNVAAGGLKDADTQMAVVDAAIEALRLSALDLVEDHADAVGEALDVLISVSDSDVGLPQGVADQIFRRFSRPNCKVPGMGLSISRSIIESHGGRLRADVNANGGATFSFTLPAAAG